MCVYMFSHTSLLWFGALDSILKVALREDLFFSFETALLDYSVLYRSDGISYPVLLFGYRLGQIA